MRAYCPGHESKADLSSLGLPLAYRHPSSNPSKGTTPSLDQSMRYTGPGTRRSQSPCRCSMTSTPTARARRLCVQAWVHAWVGERLRAVCLHHGVCGIQASRLSKGLPLHACMPPPPLQQACAFCRLGPRRLLASRCGKQSRSSAPGGEPRAKHARTAAAGSAHG